MFNYEDKEFEGNLQVLMVAPDGSKWTVLDRQDWSWAKDFKWCESGGYVMRGVRRDGKTTMFYLHREIAARMFGEDRLKGKEVDHIDRNRLNNSRQNLRLATHQQNLCNRSKHRNNTSGVPGVIWNKATQKWVVKIAGKHVGLFATKEAAIEARKQGERAKWGEFAPEM